MPLPVFSSVSSIDVNTGPRTTVTLPHTQQVGTNRALFVLAGSNRDILSATYGGTAMTPTGPQVGLRRSFFLDDPPAGTADIVVTFSLNGAQSIGAVSVSYARPEDEGVPS